MGQEDGPDVLEASANQAERSFQELDVAVPASVDQCEVGAVGNDGPVDVGAFEDEDVLGDLAVLKRAVHAILSMVSSSVAADANDTQDADSGGGTLGRRLLADYGVRSLRWHSAAIKELRAEGITEPSLVLFIGPAAAHNQELPDGGMVKGPQDVGRPGDVQR